MDHLSTSGGLRITRLRAGRRDVVSWRDIESLDWSSYGLVLGAGGVTGAAFHAGVLLALSTDHRVPLHDASKIVGTSAGAIAGTLVSHGFTAEDLAAVVADTPHHLTDVARAWNVAFRPGVPTLPKLRRLFRPPTPRDLRQACSMAVRRRYLAMVLGALRAGEYDLRPDLSFLRGARWPTPTDRLALCVTDVRRGVRRVLRHDDEVDLLESVVASCAIPAVLRGVELDGLPYADGGITSPSNADVLAGSEHPGVVLVVSPMSGTTSRTVLGTLMSRFAARQLRRELRAFSAEQTVVVVEPTGRLSEMILDDGVGSARGYIDVLPAAFTAAAFTAAAARTG